jgi:hypothetical protein
MKTKEINPATRNPFVFLTGKTRLRTILPVLLTVLFILFGSLPVSAHCDAYDGPVIRDAYKAFETNNVNLVLKWINEDQEEEIILLFNKTKRLRSGDNDIYQIIEKHFLETLVRLHRETEGAPYTGLKPAGMTQMIVQLSDQALDSDDVDGLLEKLNNHIGNVVREKHHKVVVLEKTKDESAGKGREYVKAYVDYTHTLEALHDILEHGGGHAEHEH